jgi:2'-5' RNA ligase
MADIRSFVAIELSEQLRAALAGLQQQLRAPVPSHTVRWTVPESIHLTLQFLGDVAPGNIAPIADALRNVCANRPSFDLVLEGLGVFPNPRRPRIVWVGIVEASGALNALQQAVEQVLAPLGFPPEERPFTPHLTIGRVAREADLPELTRLGEAITRSTTGRLGHMWVDHLSLMKSDLKPSGAVYTPQAVLPLLTR